MTNYNERLDEILMTFLFNGYGQDAEVYMPAADEAKQAIKQLVADEMIGLIGKDENANDIECAWGHDFQATARNEFRTELRTKLTELLGKEK